MRFEVYLPGCGCCDREWIFLGCIRARSLEEAQQIAENIFSYDHQPLYIVPCTKAEEHVDTRSPHLTK